MRLWRAAPLFLCRIHERARFCRILWFVRFITVNFIKSIQSEGRLVICVKVKAKMPTEVEGWRSMLVIKVTHSARSFDFGLAFTIYQPFRFYARPSLWMLF